MIDVKRPIETNFEGYYLVPLDDFYKMSENGATAVYLYSSNVLYQGKNERFDKDDKKVRVMKKNGVTVAPVSLFTRFLGAQEAKEDGALTLKLGEKSITLAVDGEFFFHSERGVDFVPIEAVATALEISFGVFHKDRLFVFAGKSVLSALKNDRLLMRAACYAVFGKYETAHLTHEDFKVTKDKWREILVGSPELNDSSDEEIKKKIDNISDNCEKLWAGMHKEKDAVALFGEKAPTESCDLLTQYSGVWALARAWGTYGSRYYRNEDLKRDILYAYEWMYENMYGESIIEGRGWRDPHLFNWWEWMTGAIEPMTDGLLVMEECYDIPTLQKYFRCYDYVCSFMRVAYKQDLAATRLKVGTKVALLLEDRERLFYRFLDYDLRFEPLGPTKGKYCDHADWTHGFPYNMQYGLGHMHRTVYVTSAVIDTPVEYTSPDFYDMFLTAKYMYNAAMYRGRGFAVFRGRLFGDEKGSGVTALCGILKLIGAFGEEEDTYLKKMIKVACSDEIVRKRIIESVSIPNLALLKSILADDSISAENDLDMAHSWYTADRFAQHRNDYALMLAMPSERHMSYESINSAHKWGWYTGDGALYLYTGADSQSFDYQNFLYNMNVCLRIPGVTADVRQRQLWSYRGGWKPNRSFAGSMDMYGKYGIGAFDYEAYHYEGHEADGTVDDGYGGKFTYWENDLVAKKSYHFFDKECVCLGAGINSTMGVGVKTTVEHRRLVPSASTVTVNGKEYTENFELSDAPISYATVEGVGGYVFPAGQNAYARRYTFTPENVPVDGYVDRLEFSEQDFVEIGIDSGKNPKDASYAYIVLPLADENSTRVYASCPEIEILSNTPACQAVYKSSLGITSAAFFKEGTLGDFTALVPAIVMISEMGDEIRISVCDPTQKLTAGEFKLVGKYACAFSDEELTVECADGECTLKADFTKLAGKNLTAVLKKL